jgi:hypothetical protein
MVAGAERVVRPSGQTLGVLSVTFFCANPACGAGVHVRTAHPDPGFWRCPRCSDQLVETPLFDDMPGDELEVEGVVTNQCAPARKLQP